MRQIVSMDDVERVFDRISCCIAMLSVLVDCELVGTNSTSVRALCGANELLKLSLDTLEGIMENAEVYTEGGPQYEPK